MAPEVFISYARLSSAGPAGALKAELGDAAFLDSDAIETGDTFPPELFKALLESRVVVVFAGPQYFQRWYCLRELELAIQPFLRAPNEAARRNALDHVVVVLSPDARPVDLDHLPPALRQRSWPSANDVQQQAQVVRAKLVERPPTLAERIGDRHEAVLRELLDRTAKPAPLNLASSTLPLYPVSFPDSLHDEFVGRSNELALIHHVLSTSRGTAASAALTGAIEGFGGMGKTRLALEYVHRYGSRHFPGGIFWVEADQPEAALKGSFHGILLAIQRKQRGLVAETLGRPVPDAPEEYVGQKRDSRQELALVLQTLADRDPILYVVDNVPEPTADEAAPRSLETWCPARGKVALLVTSRQSVSGQGGIHGISIEELPPDEAHRLLTCQVRASGALTREQWGEIAEWVGRHPMALDLLNQVLRRGSEWEVLELLNAARAKSPTPELDSRMQHMVRAKANLPELLRGWPEGISQAFAISYDKLSEPAKVGAQLIALLAPAPIPGALIDILGSAIGPEVRAELVDRHFVVPGRAVAEAAASAPVFGSMHRLMGNFLRDRSSQATAEAEAVARAVAATLGAAHAKRNWRLVELCVPHGLAVRRGSEQLVEQTVAVVCLALSNGLDMLGDLVAALSAIEDAIERYRKLGTREPARFEPELAGSLNNRAVLLTKLGRRDEALEDAEASVGLFERLSDGASESSRHGRVAALNNLSNRLAEVGRWERALEVIRVAVEACRGRTNEQPSEADRMDLATSLNNLSLRLGTLGRWEEALVAIQQTIEVLRALARSQPEKFEPELAGALLNLSSRSSALGRRADALDACSEAVTTFERLATMRPAAFASSYAISLTSFARALSQMGRWEQALAAGGRAVELNRRLATEAPETFDPELATSLNNLAVQLGNYGRSEEALTAITEAVSIRRKLVSRWPDVFEPDLATSLDNLATRLMNMDRATEALEAEEESIEIRTRLAKVRPEVFNLQLAQGLTNLSVHLGKMRRFDQALQASQRSLELARSLAGSRPSARMPDLAVSLNNHANRLAEVGRDDDAITATEEAVAIRRQLVMLNKEAFEPDLASSLHNLSVYLAAHGEQERALAALTEALEIRRRLAKSRPEVWSQDLSRSLLVLSGLLTSVGQKEEGAAALAEAQRVAAAVH